MIVSRLSYPLCIFCLFSEVQICSVLLSAVFELSVTSTYICKERKITKTLHFLSTDILTYPAYKLARKKIIIFHWKCVPLFPVKEDI